MISVNIPQSDIKDLKKLIELSDKQFSELILVVKELPNEINPSNLYKGLEETSIEINEINSITNIVFKLLISFTRKESSADIEKVAELFYQDFVEKSGEVTNKDSFINRFLTLLSTSDAIKNAYDIELTKRNSGNYIQNLNLSLDIKPIFIGDKKDELLGSLMISQLKISYDANNNDDDEKNIAFILDRATLLKLKELIEQVEKQGDLLTEEFSKVNIKIIE